MQDMIASLSEQTEIEFLTTLNTHQKIFNFTVRKILKEQKGKVSVQKMTARKIDTCAYRGRGGCRCMIGWLIPDKFYVKKMENVSIAMLFRVAHEEVGHTITWREVPKDLKAACENLYDLWFKDKPNMSIKFFEDLQRAHDLGIRSEDIMVQELADVAARWKLYMPPELIVLHEKYFGPV